MAIIAAALDRQHPRDLFDIRYLYDNGGITPDMFRTFLVYLISHPRPGYELLQPGLKDLANDYKGDFEEMTVDAVPLESLLETRTKLIAEISARARALESRFFLQSLFACEPDWSLLDLAADISALPAVQWKLRNLERLRAEQPAKFERELARLDEALR
ncbi:nucleotidyl transferase AbiEii/AbiGii toxin family protein [Sphingobium sp.]|uniref:nucleotidyl transferase AbiEii/AbiGii toxin family protein n=1 Tax=Sphingobium sp. TaxID=1912891 RepID=UPI0026109BFA|nr:nucleotidyl transferase AbiEii/AbiGii toxin family protein [Sphingobium sp.]